jgi:putative RecB family exonuclease
VGVPRKPTLSPTKFASFLACPLKYRWTYVDDRGRWYLRAKSYYSFGSTLHKVLERFHDSGDSGVTSTEQALSAYEEGWIEAGYSSAEEMQEAYGEGKEILERYVGQLIEKPREATTLAVESQIRMPFGDDFDLIGRIDRIDEYPDGTLEIVDYKSGRSEVTTDDVETDLAMGIYQLLVRQKFPDRKVVATIVALRTGRFASSSLTDDQAAELKSDLWELGRMVVSTNWDEKLPVAKPACAYCDFLELCRRDSEFAGSIAAFVDQEAGA